LLSIDYFALPIELTFQNKKKIPSYLGVIFTLLVASITIAITVTTGSQLLTREKPDVNVNDPYIHIPGNYSFDLQVILLSVEFSQVFISNIILEKKLLL